MTETLVQWFVTHLGGKAAKELIEKYGTDTRKISADLYIDLENDLLGLTSDIVKYPVWSYIQRLILNKYGYSHTPGCKSGGA